MVARRASLKDRTSKPPEKGRGVDALFEPSPQLSVSTSAQSKSVTAETPNASEDVQLEVPRAATFNLYGRHQDFLDEFVKSGKHEFRRRPDVGVGAVNKSAVLQELLEILKDDEALQKKVIRNLERKDRAEGSRHDPRKRRS
jgi:hypothetical protein